MEKCQALITSGKIKRGRGGGNISSKGLFLLVVYDLVDIAHQS